MSIDPETRDVIQTIYIRRVEKVGSEIRNVAFDKVENVKDPVKAAMKKHRRARARALRGGGRKARLFRFGWGAAHREHIVVSGFRPSRRSWLGFSANKNEHFGGSSCATH